MHEERQSLAIVVPCHNESEGLGQLVERLAEVLPALEADYTCEVLLIDDGSTDDTAVRMEQRVGSNPNYKLLRNPSRRGIGACLRLGLTRTDARILVNADADCTYDPRVIPELLGYLEGNDLVTGSPYHPDGEVLNVPAWRLVLSRGLSWIYRSTSPVKVYTYTSMFRAYRREVLETIPWESDGFLSVTEILIGAGRAGFGIAEYPTVLDVRRFGQSKIRIAQVMRDHLGFLARQVFRTHPGGHAVGPGPAPNLRPVHPRERPHD